MRQSRLAGELRHARCRVCQGALSEDILLSYQGMPAAAQAFPDAASLDRDCGSDLKVCQCSSCGLVQLDAKPVPYYREVIRAAAFSDEMQQFRRSQLQEWIAHHGLRGKKILEVGCGRGEYLALLDECGVEAHGLEYSAASVSACRAMGLSAQRGYVDRAAKRIPGAPFDGFMSLNFLEHWPHPRTSLKGIANNLAAGATGLVEVPNFDMILQKRLFSEFISDHLSYFTRNTFVFTLQSSGFDVIECKSVWHDYILSAAVRKRPIADLSALEVRRSELTATLREFIRGYPPGRVAIWGAGHQALAVIALSGIGRDIRYVVDSAPFKQGKFTPATHLPIVPPSALASDPVDAVLVMAASYSNEVAALVRAQCGPGMAVAVLRDYGLEAI